LGEVVFTTPTSGPTQCAAGQGCAATVAPYATPYVYPAQATYVPPVAGYVPPAVTATPAVVPTCPGGYWSSQGGPSVFFCPGTPAARATPTPLVCVGHCADLPDCSTATQPNPATCLVRESVATPFAGVAAPAGTRAPGTQV